MHEAKLLGFDLKRLRWSYVAFAWRALMQTLPKCALSESHFDAAFPVVLMLFLRSEMGNGGTDVGK